MQRQPKINADTLAAALVILTEQKLADQVPADHAAPRFDEAQILEATRAAATLQQIGRSLHRIHERQCNGYSHGYRGATYYSQAQAEAAEKADEKREKALIEKARKIVSAYGLGLSVNGDPRGPALRVLTPRSGRRNNWGDGWAV